MTIGLDLDSVLADLQVGLVPFHNDRYGTSLSPEDYIDYNLSVVWQTDTDEVLRRILEFYDSEYMNQVPPVPGARKGVEYLAGKSELVVITSRPTTIRALTEEWVEKYFPSLFNEVHLTNQVSAKGEKKKKKSEVCNELGAKVLIDDAPWYVEDAVENNIRALLMDAPWNQTFSHPKVERLMGWKEIEKHI